MKLISYFPTAFFVLGFILIGCDDNEEELDALRKQVSNLQDQLDESNTAKNTAENSLATANDTITSLRGQISSLQTDIATNTGAVPESVFVQTVQQFRDALDRVAQLIENQSEAAENGNIDLVEDISARFSDLVARFNAGNSGLDEMGLLRGIQELVADANTKSETIVLSGVIDENQTLVSGNIYILDGRVTVPEGIILTIPAGTVIKGSPGTGADASTLLVARGGKIYALGTAEKPIIMTYQGDPIQGDGTYAEDADRPGPDVRGQWGGLLVLGHAPGSFKNDEKQVQIEGIPTDDISGLYGGVNPNDDSGVMEYVSIRYGGSDIGEGNEINGLTLGGVGNQTIVNNIEVINNKDDGIEFFGGTVNASNLMVWGQGDDAIDIDQAYHGTIYNSVIVLTGASDHGLEIDGPEGSSDGGFTLTNTTIYGAANEDTCESLGGEKGELADFRSDAQGGLDKVTFKHFANGLDFELDDKGVATNYTDGSLIFRNLFIVDVPNCPSSTIASIFVDKSETTSFGQDATSFAEIVEEGEEQGANEREFEWTQWHKSQQ